ncbi:MAG TPA: hypothetical protein VI670_26450 [Thermoanaerobaculia bacterium]|jgi:hypothetical protein
MLGLDTLDIAIGLVFVYLMVSFVCSAAVELVEVVLKNRPKKLYDGINELLGSTWADNLYKHPLVSSLYKKAFNGRSGELPSYIPARNFALAVLELAKGGAPGATDLQTIENRIAALTSNNDLKKALEAIYLNAQGQAENVIKGIEDWYNSSMDRVAGWYKRYAQVWLLFFGATVAVAMNVDTVVIVKYLSMNKAARDAIVSTAGEAVKKGMPQNAKPETIKAAEQNLVDSINHVNSLGLPIGWGKNPVWDSSQICPAVKAHFLGWLLTAIAVSFGAPFWFDILNKFMVVRSTVKPKEKSGVEKSKDS